MQRHNTRALSPPGAPLQRFKTRAFDDDAAADVLLAPRLTIAADAGQFAKVVSHTLRVPRIGTAYMILGCTTLEQAFQRQREEAAQQETYHIPAFLQQLHEQDPESVQGLLELNDTRSDYMYAVGGLHAAVSVTRLPDQQLRLCIRDCDKGQVGPLVIQQRSLIQRVGCADMVTNDHAWTALQHGDRLHICPHIQKADGTREAYTASHDPSTHSLQHDVRNHTITQSVAYEEIRC